MNAGRNAGRNDSLNIQANAGKAFVNLIVELGGDHLHHGSHNHGSKNRAARHQFCSDEEYFKEVEDTSELFQLTYKCLSHESPRSKSKKK